MDIRIEKTDTALIVATPFKKEWNAFCNANGGRWDAASKTRVFALDAEAAVMEGLKEHFGYGEVLVRKMFRVGTDRAVSQPWFDCNGTRVATVFERHVRTQPRVAKVYLADEAELLSGGFYQERGYAYAEEGTVIAVMVPAGFEGNEMLFLVEEEEAPAGAEEAAAPMALEDAAEAMLAHPELADYVAKGLKLSVVEFGGKKNVQMEFMGAVASDFREGWFLGEECVSQGARDVAKWAFQNDVVVHESEFNTVKNGAIICGEIGRRAASQRHAEAGPASYTIRTCDGFVERAVWCKEGVEYTPSAHEVLAFRAVAAKKAADWRAQNMAKA